MDFSKVLFRASANGNLLTEPKSKADKEAGLLGATVKSYLMEVYIQEVFGRYKNFTNKYVEKGLSVEEDAITLYSRVKKQFFKKNEQHLSNEFIKGTPDLYTGESIHNAVSIIDVKSSWDLNSFLANHFSPVNKTYWWQLQSYMALTGAKTAILAYCLIDTPETLINDEKRKLMYKMNCATTENEDYIIACEELDKAMKFGDIPMEKKVIEFLIERDDEAIEKLYEAIKKCRLYMQVIHDEINKNS